MDRPAQLCSSPNCNLNNLIINCEGICRHRYHACCVGLSDAEVPVISASPYFFWFCDICRDHIRTSGNKIAQRSVEELPAEEKTCWSAKCIFTDQLIRCDGPCGKDFHGMCVKLTKADLAVLGSSVNIVWLCEACRSDVFPVLDGSGEEPTKEAEQLDVQEVETEESNSTESLISEDIEKEMEPAVDPFTVNGDSQTENVEQDLPTTKEGNANDGDSQMNDLQTFPMHKIPDTAVRSQIDHFLIIDPLPVGRTSTPKVFTFGESNQINPSQETSNISLLKPEEIAEKFKEFRENLAEQKKQLASLKLKIETDENNDVPAPKKLLLGTGSAVNTAAPATKYSLFVRFSVPDMSDWKAEQAVRDALGMSRRDPVTVWSVTPHHVLYPRFSTFRVDLDARWKSAALCSSSWHATENLLEHREWFKNKV